MKRKQKKIKGKTFLSNISISSFNVQGGFTSKIQLQEFRDLIQKHDIFCFQETHLEDTDLFDISDYKILKSNRKKKKSARKNSGGILMIYKETYEEGITKMHSSDKHFIWIRLDHSFFHIPDDIYLCGAYIPPANSTHFKDEDDMTILQKLQEDIAKYSNLGKILIIGDLNSRIGLLEEQISFINEHDNRDEIFESIDIPTRNSLDQGKNSSGKRLIEIMSDANLLCLNGRQYIRGHYWYINLS